MAGHSKWTQIKHKKAITDAKKSKLFSKIVREIMVAVRTGGGSNPDTNTSLRAALERARSMGLPKDNMERALQRASGGDDGTQLQSFLYEATAAHGIMILIEGITDNRNRTLTELKQILQTHGARLADMGSVQWNFEKVGGIILAQEDNASTPSEHIELLILESGARDFSLDENVWYIETDFVSLEKVRRILESQGLVIRETRHEYKPRTRIENTQALQDSLAPLLDELSEHDDVQEVYTNL